MRFRRRASVYLAATALLPAALVMTVPGGGPAGLRAAPALSHPDYSSEPFRAVRRLDPAFVDRTLGLDEPTVEVRPEGVPPRQPALRIERGTNDDLADAFVLTDGQDATRTVHADVAGATLEPGEPQPSCGRAAATIWFRYTTTSDVPVSVSTVGSAVDTVLAVYAGDGREEVTCSDDVQERIRLYSHVLFRATAGRTYAIQVGTKEPAAGRVILGVERLPPEASDRFADARPLLVGSVQRASVLEAGLEPGEPTTCFSQATKKESEYGRTVWYRLTAGDQRAIELFMPARDTNHAVLTVYRMKPGGTGVGDLEDAGNGCHEWMPAGNRIIVMDPEPGRTYFIQLGFVPGTGPAQLTLVARPLEALVNDDPRHPIDLRTLPSRDFQTTTLATGGDGPQPCGPMGATVWYRYSPVRTEPVAVDTYPGRVDTVIAIYDGDRPDMTRLVACNDDPVGEFTSTNHNASVAFLAEAGRSYLIQVGGAIVPSAYDPDPPPQTGWVRVKLRRAAAPANDRLDAAQEITAPLVTSLSTVDATTDPDERQPSCGPFGATVWYRHVARSPGALVAHVSSRAVNLQPQGAVYVKSTDTVEDDKRHLPVGFPTAIAVYDGATELGCSTNADSGERAAVSFPAVPGRTYLIQVGGLADRSDHSNGAPSLMPDRGAICFGLGSQSAPQLVRCPPDPR